MRTQHDLQMPRQVFLRKQLRDTRHPLSLFARNLQQRRVAPSDLGDRDIAQESRQLPGEMRWAMALTDKAIY